MVGLNLWWTANDGIGGHVFVGPSELVALGEEMLAQGMAWSGDEPGDGIPLAKLRPGERIAVAEIEEALAVAAPSPRTLAGRDLWRDWLYYLEGAVEHGGIVAR